MNLSIVIIAIALTSSSYSMAENHTEDRSLDYTLDHYKSTYNEPMYTYLETDTGGPQCDYGTRYIVNCNSPLGLRMKRAEELRGGRSIYNSHRKSDEPLLNRLKNRRSTYGDPQYTYLERDTGGPQCDYGTRYIVNCNSPLGLRMKRAEELRNARKALRNDR